MRLNANFGEASNIHGKYSRNWCSNGSFNYLRSIRSNATACKASTIHSEHPFKHNFWRGIYYPCKVLSQLVFKRNVHLSTQSIRSNVTSDEMSTVHAEYPFECYFWRGVYYPGKALLQQVFKWNIQLSMQHICSNATARKASTIHSVYPFQHYIW